MMGGFSRDSCVSGVLALFPNERLIQSKIQPSESSLRPKFLRRRPRQPPDRRLCLRPIPIRNKINSPGPGLFARILFFRRPISEKDSRTIRCPGQYPIFEDESTLFFEFTPFSYLFLRVRLVFLFLNWNFIINNRSLFFSYYEQKMYISGYNIHRFS